MKTEYQSYNSFLNNERTIYNLCNKVIMQLITKPDKEEIIKKLVENYKKVSVLNIDSEALKPKKVEFSK